MKRVRLSRMPKKPPLVDEIFRLLSPAEVLRLAAHPDTLPGIGAAKVLGHLKKCDGCTRFPLIHRREAEERSAHDGKPMVKSDVSEGVDESDIRRYRD